MAQLNFSNETPFNSPPPEKNSVPILSELSDCYKLWHGYLVNLPRHTKFTLGTKLDHLFVELLELTLAASYASRDKKIEIIQNLSAKFDALKFLLKILWEIGGLNNQKYSLLSQKLKLIGQQIGGWQNYCKNKPPLSAREN